MHKSSTPYLGLDVHKDSIDIAVADAPRRRGGPIVHPQSLGRAHQDRPARRHPAGPPGALG